MQLRKITQDEQEQAIFIISQAFYYNCEGEYKQLERGLFRFEDFIGAFNDDGKMIACIQNQPYYMWVDGVSVKCGGIGNVATLPEFRRSGAIKKMMKILCDEMYNEDYTMSYLYPFSHSYYRKFGYELCSEVGRIEISPQNLLSIPFDGYAKQFETGENGTDPGEIIEIYNEFSKKYNIMLDRDAWQWEKKLEHHPVKTKIRTYIVYSKEDKPIAYFTYSYDRKETTAKLTIKDMAWLDYEAMFMLFAFIGRFSGNGKSIIFHIPPEMTISYLWDEPRDFDIKYEANGMARIINAKKTLMIMKKPSYDGSFIIKINDSFMEQNNKIYKVSWDSDGTEVMESKETIDLECSIMALVQMLSGFVSLEQATSRPDLIINNNLELLKQVFPKKMVFISDYF